MHLLIATFLPIVVSAINTMAAPAHDDDLSDEELLEMADADGWQDCKQKASVRQPISWVFRDGHFKKQAKGREV